MRLHVHRRVVALQIRDMLQWMMEILMGRTRLVEATDYTTSYQVNNGFSMVSN